MSPAIQTLDLLTVWNDERGRMQQLTVGTYVLARVDAGSIVVCPAMHDLLRDEYNAGMSALLPDVFVPVDRMRSFAKRRVVVWWGQGV